MNIYICILYLHVCIVYKIRTLCEDLCEHLCEHLHGDLYEHLSCLGTNRSATGMHSEERRRWRHALARRFDKTARRELFVKVFVKVFARSSFIFFLYIAVL